MDWKEKSKQLRITKSQLMVAINHDYSCKEFLKFAQEDKKSA
jgi:hypothetical protein